MQKILVQENELNYKEVYNQFFLRIKKDLTLLELLEIAELPESYSQNFTKEENIQYTKRTNFAKKRKKKARRISYSY